LKLAENSDPGQGFPGIASTRLGVALFLEASKMLEEGVASLKDIDTGAKLFYGHRMDRLRPAIWSDWTHG